MSYLGEFIIIDDDEMNNMVCRKVIDDLFPGIEISDFIDPQEGFKYLSGKYSKKKNDQVAILLLDMSMPGMNAWQFLDLFGQLDETVKAHVKVHILSMTEDKEEIASIKSNKLVEYYLLKPLSAESIRLIVKVLNRKYGLEV